MPSPANRRPAVSLNRIGPVLLAVGGWFWSMGAGAALAATPTGPTSVNAHNCPGPQNPNPPCPPPTPPIPGGGGGGGSEPPPPPTCPPGSSSSNSPQSLPSLGEAVELHMVAGLVGNDAKWGADVGFGSGKRLNYLAKIQVLSNWRIARFFNPATAKVSIFERQGNDWRFRILDGSDLGPGATLDARDIDEDTGAPGRLTVRFGNGQEWQFAFEHFRPAESMQGFMAGPVYRVVERKTLDQYVTTIAYNENDITITDASGHQYICRLSDKRITAIEVKSGTETRTWSYAYSSGYYEETVTESGPSGTTPVKVASDGGGRISREEKGSGTEVSVTSRSFSDSGYGGYGGCTCGSFMTGASVDGVQQTSRQPSGGGTVNGKTQQSFVHYDAEGRPSGKEETYANDNLVRQRDELGRVTLYDYNDHGLMTRLVEPSGVTMSFEYNATGQATRVQAPNYADTRITYDVKGNPVERRDLVGDDEWAVYTYAFDENNRLVRMTMPGGQERRYVRDGRGAVTRYMERVDEERWSITELEQNNAGKVTKIIGPWFGSPDHPDAGRNSITHSYNYDAWGNLVSAIDPLGRVTKYEYDGANRLLAVTDPMGFKTTHAYNALGRKTRQTDPSGAYTEWVYNEQNQIAEIRGSPAGVGGCGSCSLAAGTTEKPGRYAYDDHGRKIAYTDLLGHTTAYAYDATGARTSETDPTGAVTRYFYDAAGRLSSVVDPTQRSTAFTYDAFDRLASMIDNAGNSTTFQYDAAGRMTVIRDPAGGENLKQYDLAGRLLRERTKVEGDAWRETALSYNARGDLVEAAEAPGTSARHMIRYAHDASGRIVSITIDPEGLAQTTGLAYDFGGRLVARTDALNRTVRMEYDNGDRLVKTLSPSGIATVHEYDAVGRRIRTVVDPRHPDDHPEGIHRVASAVHNRSGLLVEATDGLSSVRHRYDELGRRVQTTASGRAPVYYDYDAAGRVVAEHHIDEATETIRTTRNVYDAAGRMVKTTDAAGKETRFAYDAAGRLAETTDPLGNVTRYEYDRAGRRTAEVLPNGDRRIFAYNLVGELVRQSGGPEGVLEYRYDAAGRQTETVDANGRVKKTRYDAAGRVARVENEMDQPVIYEYDAAGQRVALTDANGNRTDYAFDLDGRVVSMRYPDVAGAPVNLETYEYNAVGDLVTKNTCNGVPLRYEYDSAGRLALMYHGPKPPPEQNIDPKQLIARFGRDAAGAVTSIADPVTTMRFRYDAFGQLSESADLVQKQALKYHYDERGLRAKYQLYDLAQATAVRPDGKLVTETHFRHDAAGRLASVGKDTDAPAVYSYDANGRRAKLALPNGVFTDYAYDNNSRLTRLATKRGDEVLASFDYTVDPTGNRTAIAYADGTRSEYEFDNAYRLTRDWRLRRENGDVAEQLYDERYTYDAVGNRLRKHAKDSAPYGSDKHTMALWHADAGRQGFDLPIVAFTTDADTRLLHPNDDSDAAYDRSEYRNDGSFAGTVTPFVKGVHDLAIQLDGESSVQVGAAESLNLADGDFTLEAWVAPADTEGERWIFSKPGAYQLGIVNGKLTLGVWTPGGVQVVTGRRSITATPALAPDAPPAPPATDEHGDVLLEQPDLDVTWTHVAATFKDNALTLWVDGRADGGDALHPNDAGVLNAPVNSGDALTIGEGFAGRLDDVRISAVCRYADKPLTDSSGQDNKGYLRGDAKIAGGGGKFRNGLFTSGLAGSFMEVPDNPNGTLELNGDFTLETWICPMPLNAGDPVAGDLFAKGSAPEQFSYRLWLEGGVLKFAASPDGKEETTQTFAGDLTGVPAELLETRPSGHTGMVRPESWTRVAVTREDGTLKLWVADEEVGRYTYGEAVFDGAGSLKIGEHYRGAMDELRISNISREGMFGVVEEQYQYNQRNQLMQRRIGTPIVMDEPEGGGATREQYAYDANGNTTEIDELVRPIRMAPGGAVQGYQAAKHLNTTEMRYDHLNRQSAYIGQEGEEYTWYRGDEWHRWQSYSVYRSTRYMFDELTDNVVVDAYRSTEQNKPLMAIYVAPGLDEYLSSFTYGHGGNRWINQNYLHSISIASDSSGKILAQYDYNVFGEAVNSSPFDDQQRYGYAGREHSHVSGLMYYRTRPYSPDTGRMFNRNKWGYIQFRMSLYDAMGNRPVDYLEPYSYQIPPWQIAQIDKARQAAYLARVQPRFDYLNCVMDGMRGFVEGMISGHIKPTDFKSELRDVYHDVASAKGQFFLKAMNYQRANYDGPSTVKIVDNDSFQALLAGGGGFNPRRLGPSIWITRAEFEHENEVFAIDPMVHEGIHDLLGGGHFHWDNLDYGSWPDSLNGWLNNINGLMRNHHGVDKGKELRERCRQ